MKIVSWNLNQEREHGATEPGEEGRLPTQRRRGP